MTVRSFRTDPETDAALEYLQADGADRSEVIRDAIKLAGRAARIKRIRADAERLRNDPDDLAEMRQIQTEMGELRVW
jgi:Arc/MetJ-type ribon-helix-helix transcriptional regulator